MRPASASAQVSKVVATGLRMNGAEILKGKYSGSSLCRSSEDGNSALARFIQLPLYFYFVERFFLIRVLC